MAICVIDDFVLLILNNQIISDFEGVTSAVPVVFFASNFC